MLEKLFGKVVVKRLFVCVYLRLTLYVLALKTLLEVSGSFKIRMIGTNFAKTKNHFLRVLIIYLLCMNVRGRFN